MVVPEGWEEISIKNIAYDVLTGGTPSTVVEEYWNGDIPWMSSGELNLKRIYSVDKMITQAGFDNSATSLIPPQCILVGLAGQGKTRGTVGINYLSLCINQSICAILPNTNILSSEYLYQYLNSKYLDLRELSMGNGGRGGLNLQLIKNFPILLPPLSEQRCIAEVLSDTDTYISSLKKLITKKEAIKQGIMQELLTGKKRLPGFNGEWIEKRLGELLEYEQPQQYIVVNTKYFTQGIPVLTAGKSFILGYTSERAGVYNNPPIILFDDFTTESKLVDFKFKVKSSAIKILKNTGICNIRIVFELMQMIKFESKDHQRFWISIFNKIRVKIPPTLAEQTAIANILSDMDQEIEALKKKLKKVESIKQGMMQKLLTGDIRLLEGTEDIKEESLSKPKLPNKNLYAAEKVYSYKTTGRHSKGFDDAVMIAGIVNTLYSPQYPLGRKKLQKCLYLLRRYQEQSTEEFKKKAAGPYADEVRYKGGEPIAIKSKYIISHKGTKGTIFSIGNNINQALEYINRWNMQADIEWVKKTLKFEKVDKLELWATVDMAICDLKSSKMPISVASIKNLIATNKEWSKKLEKLMFSDKNIAEAITILQTLFIKG
ncbi:MULTISPECIES: restriction endonuclease subunit S [Treponema]|nr:MULTISPECIES: restriction endonuclease subunit S [Treponema]EMB35502.1 hypothetical protein HMPREF9721_01784 [Treponema denticola ATCC 35404]EMB41215.1 hypothetical protein HMPREF9735_00051 [Treponema denticola ATCC 33521]HCY95566.1 restriction endonuclease subunit S [Treponema sp.]